MDQLQVMSNIGCPYPDAPRARRWQLHVEGMARHKHRLGLADLTTYAAASVPTVAR